MKKSCMPRGRKKWKRKSRRKNSESPERRLPRFETQLGTSSRLLAGVRLAEGARAWGRENGCEVFGPDTSPSFVGLREDKLAGEVVREVSMMSMSAVAQWELRCPLARTDQWVRRRSSLQSSRLDPLQTPSPTFVTAIQAAFRISTGSGRSGRQDRVRPRETPHPETVRTRRFARRLPIPRAMGEDYRAGRGVHR